MVVKEFNSAFRDTNLDTILKEKQVKRLVLIGINASGCVQDTAMGAIKRGFEIITARGIVASSSKNDSELKVSKKWYTTHGTFYESTKELIQNLI